MRRASIALALMCVVGCAFEQAGETTAALAPPGSDAAVVGHTIPLMMHPGERLAVTVTMANTGTGGASNTWTQSGPQYAFFRTSLPKFGFDRDPVESTVSTGGNSVHHFVLTAPAMEGSYSFSGRMGITGDERFGEELVIPTIVVSNAVPRTWDCAFDSGASDIPTMLAPGETRSITVAVQNTGTATWTAGTSFALYSQDSPLSLWGNTIRYLNANVGPGSVGSFTFNITAPTAPGPYSLRRQMFGTGVAGVGFFDKINSCVDVPITVGGVSALDAALVTHTLPGMMAPGEVRSVTVTMQNTGTTDWLSNGTFFLYSKNSPISLYGVTLSRVTTTTGPSDTFVFTFTIRAPSAEGPYSHRWQLFRAGTGYFGGLVDIPLTVTSAAMPPFDAQVVSQTIPSPVSAGQPATFQIEMQNTGTEPWSGSTFRLSSTNSPISLWGTTGSPLGSGETVPSGGTRVFTLNVVAPDTDGTYPSRWRMQGPSIGLFGAEAMASVDVVLCGNEVIDPGETCDDGNLMDGDGCSSTCQAQTATYDLAVAGTADRGFFGSTANRQLGNVTIADATNDGTPDVIVSENANVTPPGGGAVRTLAGTVYGFSGGGGFFTNGTTTLPDAPTFRVFGGATNDRLGATSSGGIAVGDVTGDSIPDLVVSAAFADGEMDARVDAGEVYVLSGAALSGDIDLGAIPAPTALLATVIGSTAGSRLSVLAIGDLVGDTTADLVLGAPYEDVNGTDSGAVYVVTGGAGLAGIVDLNSPGITTFRIDGPAANARMGGTAAVGNFTGTARADLLVGNGVATIGGRSRTGAAWGFQGPLTTNRDTSASVGSASGPDLAWFGETQNDNLGTSVAIGNVTGGSELDVLIGAPQARRAGLQVGSVDVWVGPIAGGTYDLSAGATPHARFLGAEQYDNAGTSLAVADINGDGYDDIPIVSTTADGPGNARDRAGETAVYFGRMDLMGTTDLSVNPAPILIYAAEAVDLMGAHAGNIAVVDIDGDMLADLCVGSYLGGPGNVGRVDCIQSVF